MSEQVPSKKLISDDRLRRLRADWAQADETGCYPGVIEASAVLLVCDELIASRAAHEPSALRAVVQSVVDWNTKYPSGRVYDYGAIKGIAAEMDVIFQQAKAALDGASQPPFVHPYGQHPHQICGCGAKVPTDVHLLHTCGDRLTPKGSSQPPSPGPLAKAAYVFAGPVKESFILKLWFETQADLDAAFDLVEGSAGFVPMESSGPTKRPECQHDKSKPGPTLVPLGSAAFGSSDWTWMCTVCNDRFNLPTATAQGEIDG